MKEKNQVKQGKHISKKVAIIPIIAIASKTAAAIINALDVFSI